MPAFGNQAAKFSFAALPKHLAARLDGAALDVLWYRSSVQDRDGELPARRIGNMGELVACGEKAQPDHTGKDIAAEDDGGGKGGEQDIAVVLEQVAALRSEIDRLIGLVDSAVRKLED
jgi:hypothetical protein